MQAADLVGQVLFAIADLARQMGIDPEQALRNQAMLFGIASWRQRRG